ncbi:MAG: adenylosuccinate synthase [Sphingomonadales bacterium]|nr:adenylosuccinate synthase [Sphingomonadales bacterium]
MVDVILGLQWGDEGKGKIADFLTPQYDIVARFQGGPNAGHSLEFEGKKFVLNTIPSGIFRKGILNIIGNGVVVDPIRLLAEIDRIKDECPDYAERLLVSKKAHLILPTHRILDAASEASKGDAKIGSTLRGIGPTYRDKTGRSGLRIGDALEADFIDRYKQTVEMHLTQIASLGYTQFNLQEEETAFFAALEDLKKLQLVNSEYLINEAIQQGKKILAEGAQGSMLDVEFGSYPFVTSSTTLAGGVCSGLGVAPKQIRKVYGIFKSYCTRVGGGPFPTELNDDMGELLRKKGHEFGATTGRPRRTGWLDMVALKYTCMLNGVDELIMMKSDVMCDIPEVKAATSYTIHGEETNQVPANLCSTDVLPNYRTFTGFGAHLDHSGGFDALPDSFKDYITFIEENLNTPIRVISLGPERDKTIVRNK